MVLEFDFDFCFSQLFEEILRLMIVILNSRLYSFFFFLNLEIEK